MKRLLVVVWLLMPACRLSQPVSTGGYLVVGVSSDPQTWNRLLASDLVTHEITEQLHAALVRINRVTQQVEPALAESWWFSEDGKTLTFRIRAGVRFSDGTPLTADDVAFTFRAIHDPAVGSPLAETAKVGQQPLVAEVVDALTVRFRLPHRTAVVERQFDSLYILPRHRLEGALEQGTLAAEYAIGASAEGVVGLGPFVLERYLPGERVLLRRNTYYWKTGTHGEPLPRLDGIRFEIQPDTNALVLRFRAGELDLVDRLSPEDFVHLRRNGPPSLELLDLGPGMTVERLWFNLNPSGSPATRGKRAWFADVRFRKAISLALDRGSIVRLVYRGLAAPAAGPVSPGNRMWRNEAIRPPDLDRAAARRLLGEAGFCWDADGKLQVSGGRRVRFSLVTNSDNPHRSRTAALIQQDLSQIGIEMSLVPLAFANLIGRITRTFDYDACLFGITFTDPDPSAELPLWLSRSPLHVWHPLQLRPASAWEARIDELMEQQMLAVDLAARKVLYGEVQGIVAKELPMLHLVVPHVILGKHRRVKGLRPTPFWLHPLWNGEEISVEGSLHAEPPP